LVAEKFEKNVELLSSFQLATPASIAMQQASIFFVSIARRHKLGQWLNQDHLWS